MRFLFGKEVEEEEEEVQGLSEGARGSVHAIERVR